MAPARHCDTAASRGVVVAWRGCGCEMSRTMGGRAHGAHFANTHRGRQSSTLAPFATGEGELGDVVRLRDEARGEPAGDWPRQARSALSDRAGQLLAATSVRSPTPLRRT